ncbi:MAG: hypothetical protein H6602_01295 [Flavobacteriales bacterium]|nr:hypothetical protein [Flavobacteriales bacterium]
MEKKSVSRISSDLLQLLTGSELVLSVTSENLLNSDDEEKLFHRVYYRTLTSDGKYSYFRTTNEPEWTDDGYGKVEVLGETFVALSSFEDLVADLCNTSILEASFGETVGQPKYIYYDIEFMDESLKKPFRNHLSGVLWRFPDEYLMRELSGWELRQLDQWKKGLLPPDDEHVDNRVPLDKNLLKALAYSSLVLSIQKPNELHPEISGPLYRQYFKSSLKSGNDVFFLNTNEPVHQSKYLTNCKKVGSAFTAFFSIEDVIYDLNHYSEAADDKPDVHGPPKYVYYDLLFVTDELKQFLHDHLHQEVTGYSEDYFRKYFGKDDQKRIAHWKSIVGTKSTP